MTGKPHFRGLGALCVALTFVILCLPHGAEARNVPGSAAAATLDLSEIATEELANGILDALKGSTSAAGVSRDSSGRITFSTFGAGFKETNGLVGGASVSYRDLDFPGEVEGGLITGAVSIGQRMGDGTLLFGALLLESVDADTPFNAGTIDGTGVGLAFGAQGETAGGLQFTGMLGALSLDYDVTRSGGTITGSYGAQRWFVDLRGSTEVDLFPSATTSLDFGLRYVQQNDDAYTETGGGPVAAISYSNSVIFLNSRTFLSDDQAMRPYVQANLRGVLGDSNAIPGISSTAGDHVRGYLGLGVEGGQGGVRFDTRLGVHFDQDGYNGFGAGLNVNITF
jgi:hypothetical protein